MILFVLIFLLSTSKHVQQRSSGFMQKGKKAFCDSNNFYQRQNHLFSLYFYESSGRFMHKIFELSQLESIQSYKQDISKQRIRHLKHHLLDFVYQRKEMIVFHLIQQKSTVSIIPSFNIHNNQYIYNSYISVGLFKISFFCYLQRIITKMSRLLNEKIDTAINQTPLYHSKTQESLCLSNQQQQRQVLRVDAENIDRCLRILMWRFKTSLPIIKPNYFKIFRQASRDDKNSISISRKQNQEAQVKVINGQNNINEAFQYVQSSKKASTFQLNIEIEEIKYRLSDIKLLPLPQIVYLLKEMMVGYEVLVDIFGIFQPEDSMIIITAHDQWRIWVNNTFQQYTTSTINISQKQFIYRLILIAENHCVHSSSSQIFFNQLKEFTYKHSCNFSKLFQKIKDSATSLKVFQSNKVFVPKDSINIENRTLTKTKGYNRIYQMRSSFQDGKFIPKENLSIKSHRKSNYTCINFQQKLQNHSLASPLSNINSIDSAKNCFDTHQLSFRKKQEHCSLNDFQLYTPQVKINNIAANLFTPTNTQQNTSKRQIKLSCNNPRINITTADSKIQKRRRSQVVKLFTWDSARQEAKNHEQQNNQKELKRQTAYNDLTKLAISEYIEDQINIKKDYESSFTTIQGKQSTNNGSHLNNNTNSQLKKNDLNSHLKTHIQSSFEDNKQWHNIVLPKNEKNMSVSFQFPSKNQEKDNHQLTTNQLKKEWKNTISNLFSDTTTIKHLKTSIKIKQTSTNLDQQKRYSSDIKFQVLHKMGRNAKQSYTFQPCQEGSDDNNEPQMVSDLFTSLRDSQQELLPPNPHRKNHNAQIYDNILEKIKQLSTITLNCTTRERFSEEPNQKKASDI